MRSSVVSWTISAFFRHSPMCTCGIGPEGGRPIILQEKFRDALEIMDVLPVDGHTHRRGDTVAAEGS